MFHITVLLLVLISNYVSCQCPIRKDNICCAANCFTCDECDFNSNDYGCCTNLIALSNNYCDQIQRLPCILRDGYHFSLFKRDQDSNNTSTTGTTTYSTTGPVETGTTGSVETGTTSSINTSTNSTNTNDNYVSDIDMLIAWAKSLTIIELSAFIIGCGIVVLFVLYACCCFGRKKPPMKYSHLKGKFNIPE